MRLKLALFVLALGPVAAAPALADCSTEVALAVNSQGKQKFIRKETNMITEAGPAKMVVEYVTPDRMRQVLTPLAEGSKPVESIVVGDKAWTNTGGGWREAPRHETDQLIQFMITSIAQVYQEVGRFECVGTETIDGRELRGYRGLDELPGPPGKQTAPAVKNEAVRMIYLDPKTGLPARSVFARKGFLDKPIFLEVYLYPETIEIEPPKDVAPAAEPPPADGKP